MLSLLLVLACQPAIPVAGGPPVPESSSTAPTAATGLVHTADSGQPSTTLPGHNECLPPGERMSDETCLAVVAHDGRFPGQSYDKSGVDPGDDDPRVGSDDLRWLTGEVERCTCSCCHQSTLGGPGAYFWDLDYDGVWLDSASDWSLRVLAGIQYSDNQVLPSDDLERVKRIIEEEIARRDR